LQISLAYVFAPAASLAQTPPPIALRGVLYFLMRTPSTYARVISELDSAIVSNSLSNPIKFSEAVKLPYLCACVKEAMRMHPSVGLTLPRIVFHYDKGFFGEDAD
jgi:hypothetical protein